MAGNPTPDADQHRLLNSLLRFEEISLGYAGRIYLEQNEHSFLRHDSKGVQLQKIWRARFSEWCFSFIDNHQANIPRDVVYVTMNILDRFLSKTSNQLDFGHESAQTFYELASLTSMYVATKVYVRRIKSFSDSESKKNFLNRDLDVLTIPCVLHSSTSGFEAIDLEKMELLILETLGWCISPLSPSLFVRSFVLCMDWSIFGPNIREDVYQEGRFFCEMATCDYFFVNCKASAIGLAAIVSAMEEHQPTGQGSCSFNARVDSALQFASSFSGFKCEKATLVSMCERLTQLRKLQVDHEFATEKDSAQQRIKSSANMVHVISSDDLSDG